MNKNWTEEDEQRVKELYATGKVEEARAYPALSSHR